VQFARAASAIALAALPILISTPAVAAETASTILKKMAGIYAGAKSYQATIKTIQNGKTQQGKPFTISQTEHVAYQSPNRFHKSVKLTGTGAAVAGPAAAQLAMRQGEIYSDGKTATMYVPARKIYQKQAVPATVLIAQLVDLLRLVPGAQRPGLTLLPTTGSSQGREAFVIELKPIQPKGLNTADMKKFSDGVKKFKQFPRFLVDKKNYNLLEYSIQTTDGGAVVDLQSQVFGGSIASSAFDFIPPAGAKEFKGTPPGQPGATPGGPGSVPGAPGGAPGVPPSSGPGGAAGPGGKPK